MSNVSTSAPRLSFAQKSATFNLNTAKGASVTTYRDIDTISSKYNIKAYNENDARLKSDLELTKDSGVIFNSVFTVKVAELNNLECVVDGCKRVFMAQLSNIKQIPVTCLGTVDTLQDVYAMQTAYSTGSRMSKDEQKLQAFRMFGKTYTIRKGASQTEKKPYTNLHIGHLVGVTPATVGAWRKDFDCLQATYPQIVELLHTTKDGLSLFNAKEFTSILDAFKENPLWLESLADKGVQVAEIVQETEEAQTELENTQATANELAQIPENEQDKELVQEIANELENVQEIVQAKQETANELANELANEVSEVAAKVDTAKKENRKGDGQQSTPNEKIVLSKKISKCKAQISDALSELLGFIEDAPNGDDSQAAYDMAVAIQAEIHVTLKDKMGILSKRYGGINYELTNVGE